MSESEGELGQERGREKFIRLGESDCERVGERRFMLMNERVRGMRETVSPKQKEMVGGRTKSVVVRVRMRVRVMVRVIRETISHNKKRRLGIGQKVLCGYSGLRVMRMPCRMVI